MALVYKSLCVFSIKTFGHLLLAQQQKKIAESETKLVNDAVFGSFGNRSEASFDVSSEIFFEPDSAESWFRTCFTK